MELLCKIFGHKWQRVPNRCYDQRKVCKDINHLPHDYKDGKCIRCGDPAPLPRQKRYSAVARMIRWEAAQ